ncbi:MAG: succinate dehydrogenase [Alphaproteobacteria bacterium]|nr:succinate dehydrogenase [Alphaproteobacteria bacterium]
MEARLYALQRLSAVVMAPLVVVHLITIMVAVRGGLTAEEILARTQGVTIWSVFYAVFVLAVAIHAPLGLRKILREWARLPQPAADGIAVISGLLFLLLGGGAVLAVGMA